MRVGWTWLLLITVATLEVQGAGTVAGTGTTPATAQDRPAAADDEVVVTQQLQAAAERGEAEAQFVLGFFCDVGVGVRLDHERALVLLRAAAEREPAARAYLKWKYESGFGLPQADVVAAGQWEAPAGALALPGALSRWAEVAANRVRPRFGRVLLWMMDRAAAEDVVAQLNLADVYLAEEWTKSDAAQHLYWLGMAAERGSAEALERMAAYYDEGRLVARNPGRALEFRRRAAELGRMSAQLALGRQYRDGQSVAPDPATAAQWLGRAAAQGDVRAMVEFAALRRLGGPGLPVDYSAALTLLRRAVDRGDPAAMCDLAAMLREGQGTPVDAPAAAALYARAAQAGYAYGADVLGWMHARGELGAPDLRQAREWYTRAAEAGNRHAMSQLGVLWRDGQGGEKDLAQAKTWFERAARQGDTNSQVQLGLMLRNGLGGDVDLEGALEWFRQAARNGAPEGSAQIGFHHLFGLGVPRSMTQALAHLVTAAREWDDPWLKRHFRMAVAAVEPEELEPVHTLLQTALEDPRLMLLPGPLPELGLEVLQSGPEGLRDESAARVLLARMRESRRPQAALTIAWYAFLGAGMPYDLAVARAALEQGAARQPEEARRLRAVIESVAAETPEARAAARAELHARAEAGDVDAARALLPRLITGVGDSYDLPSARKYYELVSAPTRSRTTPTFMQFVAQFGRTQSVPDEAELRRRRAELRRQRGDAAAAVLYRTEPAYPIDLRRVGGAGEATVNVTVDSNGLPAAVRCVAASHPLMARAAEAAVLEWRFAPAMRAGTPVASELIVPLVFSDPAAAGRR